MIDKSETTSSPLRVLLVEDNPAAVELLETLLKVTPSTSIQIVHAQSLREALRLLGEQNFDAVLVDLGLPNSQGLEAVYQIQSQNPEIPVVVLTGLNDETVAIRSVQQGAQDCLIKGEISGHLLVRSIKYAVERKRAQQTLSKAKDELENQIQERTAKLLINIEMLRTEIENRQQIQKELTASKQLLENIAQGIADGILLLSRDYRILWAN